MSLKILKNQAQNNFLFMLLRICVCKYILVSSNSQVEDAAGGFFGVHHSKSCQIIKLRKKKDEEDESVIS